MKRMHSSFDRMAMEDETDKLDYESQELLSAEEEDTFERSVLGAREKDAWSAAARNAIVCTYLAEVVFYIVRKAPSIVKVGWQQDLHLTVSELGALDTTFLGFYTASQFVSGFLGNRFGGRLLISTALLGAAVCSLCTGLASSFTPLLIVSAAHGAFQALGYPACISLLSEHVSSSSKASILGVWGTNCAVGGVIGMWMGAYLLEHYGWCAVFLVPAPIILATSVLSFVLLEDSTGSRGMSSSMSSSGDGTSQSAAAAAAAAPVLGFYEAMMLPDVLRVGAAYFFLKFGRYSINSTLS
jgi:OPA family sugar phosphate sensor protein UhpC-like MFS transporter